MHSVDDLVGGIETMVVSHDVENNFESTSEGIVSFQTELPMALQSAMTSFIEKYPNWDQYRLIQAALAGFLVQNGVESRAITRLYVGNMFRNQSLVKFE